MSNPPQEIPCEEVTTKIGESDLDTLKFSYTWTVDNFTSSTAENGEKLVSPIFTPKPFRSQWRLEVSPWRSDAPSLNNITVFLRLVSANEREIAGALKCSILNAQGESVFSSYRFDEWQNVRCGDTFVNRIDVDEKSLMNDKKNVLPDDKLTILCEVHIMRGFISSETKVRESALLDDVGRLFETRKFSDFSINVSGRELTAHRAILASRSTVFSKMFEIDAEKDDRNHIVINDIDYEVIDEMLRFVYTGRVKNIEKIADRLLVAADRYALEELKNMCESALYENIGIENAANILKLSMINNCGTLQMLAIGYVEKYKNEVLQTAGFEEFTKSHPDLAAEIRGALEGTRSNSD